MTQNELYLVLGVNAVLSFAMLAIGITSYIRVKKFLASAIETKGVVIEKIYKGSGDSGGSMYSPEIQFIDKMGQTVKFTENWSSNRPDFKIGDEVVVLYDPANPQKARRGGKKWKFFFVAWLLGGLGILFSSILVLVLILFAILGVPVAK